MKKASLLFLCFSVLFLGVGFAYADRGPLVPCGPGTDVQYCRFCHLFVLFNNIVGFLLINVVPALAVLMVALGGFMYIGAYTGFLGDASGSLNKAKELFKSVAIGLFLIYGAWLIVSVFMLAIGVADWTGLRDGWNIINIDCP